MTRSLIIAAALATASFAPGLARAADQARDHAAILAMSGTFKVTFDMRETVPFVAGYAPYPAKVMGGHEVVRVVEDRPDFVSLQHLLVVDMEDGKPPMIVKHWRQDWSWQPQSVLTYKAKDHWVLTPVARADAAGAWSQTVWQTDDSPRYGAVGRWRYDDGVARWMSGETLRPLARRDATRNPPYDHYVGTNRHALTPAGWVQEQDNAKVGAKDGKPVTFVHEVVTNSYVPATDFKIAAADEYWARTKDYWAAIRAEWDARIARDGGLTLAEEAETGSATGHELMLIADDVASGEVKLADATKEAREVIAKEVGKPAP